MSIATSNSIADVQTDTGSRQVWVKPVVLRMEAGGAENVNGNPGADGNGSKGS